MHPRETFRRMWRGRCRPALISVHRGLWHAAPENSLPAIRAGAKFGIVEIDVQVSRDGVPVVMHDTSLERMTGTPQNVGDCLASEIMALALRDGPGGADAPTTNETVPDLAGAVAALPKGAFFDIDVKHPTEIDAVAEWLSDNGAAGAGSLKIDVAGPQDVQRLRALEDAHGLMVMAKVDLSRTGPDLIARLAESGVAAAEVWFDDLADLSDAARAAGEDMAISTYTLDPVHCCGLSDTRALVDPASTWGALLDAGVTVIMTDRAPELAAYLGGLQA